MASGGAGVILCLSLVKEIPQKVDEENRFILLRLKIFLFIISSIVLLFAFSYVTVMYDNRTKLATIKTTYACNMLEGQIPVSS